MTLVLELETLLRDIDDGDGYAIGDAALYLSAAEIAGEPVVDVSGTRPREEIEKDIVRALAAVLARRVPQGSSAAYALGKASGLTPELLAHLVEALVYGLRNQDEELAFQSVVALSNHGHLLDASTRALVVARGSDRVLETALHMG